MHTVLLIEDQFDVASMLRLILSRGGYRALLANNLAEARDIWSAYKNEIDLVLTDNNLPDGSGVQFAQHLAHEKPSLKVVVASGIPQDNLPRSFYRADKPFHMSDLLDTLATALNEPDIQ
jgi:DNA-binding NtrC family response regulator